MEIRHLRSLLDITITPVHAPSCPNQSTSLPSQVDVMKPIEAFLTNPSPTTATTVQRASPYSHVITILHDNKPVFDNLRSRINKSLHQDATMIRSLFTPDICSQTESSAIEYQCSKLQVLQTISLCPACQTHNETTQHIYLCPEPSIALVREVALVALQTSLQKHAPPIIIDMLILGIRLISNQSSDISPASSTIESLEEGPLLEAYHSQSDLGWDALLRGHVFKRPCEQDMTHCI